MLPRKLHGVFHVAAKNQVTVGGKTKEKKHPVKIQHIQYSSADALGMKNLGGMV